MPAYAAHYACGELARHQALADQTSVLTKSIDRHQRVYNVGLAGPDIFFYSALEMMHKGMKIGRAMHKYRTDQFLSTLYHEAELRKGGDRETALAYFAGFMGHYALDASAHPFIYRTCRHEDEKRALGKHFRYEAAMDAFVCTERLGKNISDLRQDKLTKLTHKEKIVVSQVLSQTIRKVYPDAKSIISQRRIFALLTIYPLLTWLLQDPIGWKELLYLRLEKHSLHYSLLASLFINDHRYGLGKREWQAFEKRFNRGIEWQKGFLALLDEAQVHPKQKEHLMKAIGSRSYHTGRHEDGRETEIDWT